MPYAHPRCVVCAGKLPAGRRGGKCAACVDRVRSIRKAHHQDEQNARRRVDRSEWDAAHAERVQRYAAIIEAGGRLFEKGQGHDDDIE